METQNLNLSQIPQVFCCPPWINGSLAFIALIQQYKLKQREHLLEIRCHEHNYFTFCISNRIDSENK